MGAKNVLVDDTPTEQDIGIQGPAALLPDKADKTKNWASVAVVRERLEKEIYPLLDVIRERRRPLMDVWRSCDMMWNMEHEEQMYDGRSNIFLPAGHEAIERKTTLAVEATFPSDDVFSVEAKGPTDPKTIDLTKGTIRERVDNTVRLREQAELYYRQLYTKGSSTAKVFWSKRSVKGVTQRTSDPLKPIAFDAAETMLHEGPEFSVRPIEHVYFFPENVNKADECEIIFEDMSVSFREMVYRAKKGRYDPTVVEEIKNNRIPTREQSEQQAGQAQGIQPVSDAQGWSTVDVTEVWFDFDPKNDGETVPFVAVFAAGRCLRATRNPFWHQRKPYVLGTICNKAGRLYGFGTGEKLVNLNKLLNDQVNQTMDCGTYVLNPIAITNPNNILGRLPGIAPGVNIKALNINEAVKFDRPPVELIQFGQAHVQSTLSMIMDFGGAPPVLSGGSAPGRAFKTGMGVAAADRNAKMPVQEVVRLSEKQVWEPVLYMIWALDQQFADKELLARMAGGEVEKTTPEAVAGDWNFRWLASTQASNQMVKAQQLMQGLQVVTSPQIAGALQREGKVVNVSPIIRQLWTDGFGMRNYSEIIVAAPAAPPGLPPGMPPGMLGAEAGPPVEAPPGMEEGQPEGLAGEPGFTEARGAADQLAAMLGGMPAA